MNANRVKPINQKIILIKHMPDLSIFGVQVFNDAKQHIEFTSSRCRTTSPRVLTKSITGLEQSRSDSANPRARACYVTVSNWNASSYRTKLIVDRCFAASRMRLSKSDATMIPRIRDPELFASPNAPMYPSICPSVASLARPALSSSTTKSLLLSNARRSIRPYICLKFNPVVMQH